MSSKVEIVVGSVEDSSLLGQLFYDAVRSGAPAYTLEQREAWAPSPKSGAEFQDRLREQVILIARSGSDSVGFMTMKLNGYIDFAYIILEWQGRGLFPRLFEPLEAEAMALNLKTLSTHASLMARPAFEKVGFTVLKQEIVEIGKERLPRFVMEKQL